ncbi:NAD(P)-dependent oxidoreductase [Lignipirellula cremea]|uniref:D-3-phosphoglycerate dehydrogenase n=1 Tax=Lignipirellula cremea TaxID=2528010 RepID=A0A518DR25_9BACT|nr:NAD(P)-dependent oxidoreductase [Lignipirellula cremea]QDU94272.1 D-3-phosphoglycerate dehydrogenase [Lignipirellula cremea]
MKVLIADKLSSQTVDELTALGAQVEVRPDLTPETLPAAVADAQVLIVRSTRVDAAVLEAAPRLGLVIRAGAGVNTIDLKTASARGVYVANCPGKNTAAVAELALGLLIAADRGIAKATFALQQGSWQKKAFGDARGLKGRTLGILGWGAIGQALGQRAQALEMNLVVWSRSLTDETAEQAGVERAADPLELAARSDAVSVHLAFTPQTKHLVDAAFLAAMPDGAILVNTSRGELIDTEALLAAIRQKSLKVGLDVFEDEPAGGAADFSQTQLAQAIVCTPHIGASTDEAADAIAAEVVRIVRSFRDRGRPPEAVNLCARSPATHHLTVRHFNRVGVLAGVMDGLRAEGVNVEEMENVVFEGALAACCTLRLDQSPSPALLEQLAADASILDVQLEADAGPA